MGKSQPLTDEQQQLRQLTREAHEAAQNARQAIRELQAARAEFNQIADEKFETMVNPRLDELFAHLSRQQDEISAALRKTLAAIEQTLAEHLGARNYEELLEIVVKSVSKEVREATLKLVSERVNGYIDAAIRKILKVDKKGTVQVVIESESRAHPFASRDQN